MSQTYKNRIIDYTAASVILISVFICLVPFLYILSQSLSSNKAIISQAVTIYPIDFNIDAYKVVFGDAAMLYSLFYTVILTGVFVLISLTVTILAAYPLTKKTQGQKCFIVIDVVYHVF